MKFPFFFVVLLPILVLEGAVRYLPLPHWKLEMVWLAVLFLGFYVPLMPGGLIVLLLALIRESLGAPIHGVLPLAYLGAYLFLRLARHHIFFQRRTSQVIWVALLSLAYRGVEAGLLAWQGYGSPAGWGSHFAWASLEGAASLAVFPLLRMGAGRERRFGV